MPKVKEGKIEKKLKCSKFNIQFFLKLVGINIKDDLASKLNSINDVELYMPGLLSATQEWFRVYKIPTGKPENKFAFNGEFKDKEFAHKIIEETNEFWKSLISRNETGGLNTLVYFLII